MSSNSQPQQSYDDYVMLVIEDALEDAITMTPPSLVIEAEDIAAFHQAAGGTIETADVSPLLSRFRYLQGKGRTQYVIGTVDRGPHSQWMILAFPGMTPAQTVTSTEILAVHDIMSVMRETMDPMLRNIRWEFIPTMKLQQRTRRSRYLINNKVALLTGLKTTLLTWQHDLTLTRPAHLRLVVQNVSSAVTTRTMAIDQVIRELQAL